MNIAATRKALRKFGLTLGIGLLVLAGILFWKEHPVARWIALVGGLLIISGLTFPPLLRPFYRVWMAIAFALAWFNTRLILGLIFYLLFTPVGLVIRLFRHDALQRRPARDADTYWIDRRETSPDPKQMERLY